MAFRTPRLRRRADRRSPLGAVACANKATDAEGSRRHDGGRNKDWRHDSNQLGHAATLNDFASLVAVETAGFADHHNHPGCEVWRRGDRTQTATSTCAISPTSA